MQPPNNMKATLEFSLPEEQELLDIAVRGADAVAALHDIMSMFRRTLKYDPTPMSAEELRKEAYQILLDRGIKIDV